MLIEPDWLFTSLQESGAGVVEGVGSGVAGGATVGALTATLEPLDEPGVGPPEPVEVDFPGSYVTEFPPSLELKGVPLFN